MCFEVLNLESLIVPTYLRCEYLVNPLGIDVLNPRLSWILESSERAQNQTAYRILVSSSKELLEKNQGDLWDTGKVKSNESIHIVYDGKSLKSQMYCFWKVMVWDKNDNTSDWSEPAHWSMGLLEFIDWKAKWVGPKPKKFYWLKRKFPKKFDPVSLLRRSFSVDDNIKRAMIYVTALGEYEIYLNGKRVGDHYLAPEWTDYDERVQYQTFNVTELLNKGENVVGALLADGWYAGHIGLTFLYNHSVYGIDRRLRLQLIIELKDGTIQDIVTDADWKIFKDGPIRKADHFKGEEFDACKEQTGWDKPGFDDSDWPNVAVDDKITKKLTAQINEPIRLVKEVKPIAVTEPKPGIFIYNLGQNIAGWCKIRLGGSIFEPDAMVTLKHAEMLKEDGMLYRRNLKTARAMEKYTLCGSEKRELHPHFTYHGFQYVGVKGLKPGIKPDLDMVTGCAIASDTPVVGAFESSDPTLNQLWSNIIWTQRDNLISVPTDCPNRCERLGWMGDAQVFCQTSIYNMDMAAFYTKWVRDIREAQTKDGKYPDFVPNTRKKKIIVKNVLAPAWADCGVIIPWKMYLNYGDKTILEHHFKSMKKFIDHIHSKNSGLVWKRYGLLPIKLPFGLPGLSNLTYGDWLNGDTIKSKDYPKKGAAIPTHVFATAYFAHSTELLSKMAKVLGLSEDSAYYADLAKRIRERFNKDFVTEEGMIKGDTQAGYALALHFNLLPEELRPQAVKYLLRGIEKYDNRISTGFCSTLPMMLELTKRNHNDVAYQLLQSRRFPSWYYMIDQGATSMWERWDGYVKGRGFQSWFMNSFNHYSIGSIGEWIYRVILGINLDENQPGYKHIIIQPRPGGTLTWAKGHYNSIRGKIGVNWSLKDEKFNLEVTIPANTSATVYIPATDPNKITESGKPLTKSEEIELVGYENSTAQIEIKSGTYRFESKILVK